MDAVSRRDFMKQAGLAGAAVYGLGVSGTAEASTSGPGSEPVSTRIPKGDKLANRLFKEICKLEVIDAHEHLGPEKNYTDKKADIFTLINHYAKDDALRSGMEYSDWERCLDTSIPLDERWRLFSPHWKNMRLTSYSRAVLISVKHHFGFDDINDSNYEQVCSAIQAANKPGIYDRFIRKACRIRTCLTQCGITNTGTDLLTPLMPMIGNLETREGLENPLYAQGSAPKTLDAYLDTVGDYILKVKSEGAVGMKIFANQFVKADKAEAASQFDKIRSGEVSFPSMGLPFKTHPLRDYVKDWAIDFAGKQGLVIAVHAGYWMDCRDLHPLHMIPVIYRHPKVRFDVYHLGYPWIRETLMLGKSFNNIWINFCWDPIISQRATLDAFDEAIDMLPANKILGFGGDYMIPENVYGHLTMARECIAQVLASRVGRGELSEDTAIEVAKKWLFSNANELYNLGY
ncbi:MAG: amidohydrolase family protein [Armatimonadota bacterium]